MTFVLDADFLATIQRSGHAAAFTALGRLPVVITDAVWDELTINARKYGIYAKSVEEMLAMLVAIAGEATPIRPQSAEAETLAVSQAAPPSEGPGELSAIAFALHHADAVPVLIDRKALRRAVEELRGKVLSLHGVLDVLRSDHGLPPAVVNDISDWYCARNRPVRPPVWW
jgi:hypothetical protein